ncbi:ERG2/sigma1 receptor-like protein [Gautieria morchelliformis]|nr:ERG2/sigma1 receptor-like protein [Gautieria morchelliformis]
MGNKPITPPQRRDYTGLALVWGSILFLAIAAGTYLDSIRERFYIFDPVFLHELSKDAVSTHGNATDLIVSHIISNLTEKYATTANAPQVVLQTATTPENWVFNNAGGAMGAMLIIHASITEYLIIFGTPLGTEGHTGRHTADDYFNILVGEQWAFLPGALEKEVYPAGSVHVLPRGTAKQYKMHEGCFALEYARGRPNVFFMRQPLTFEPGWIPPMLPFGLADILFSTLDFPTFYHTARITARETIRNLMIGKI